MRFRSWLLCLVALSDAVLAQEVSLQAHPVCSSVSAGAAASVAARRAGDKFTVHVVSSFTCGTTPAQAKIGVWQSSATISVVEYVKPGQPLAACLCAQDLSFQVAHMPAGVKTIYYVQDGLVRGQTAAP
jgi:hypothetical protein